MRVSESWLREWVSPRLSAREIGDRLTLAGLELDSIAPAGAPLDNSKIVVGEIVGLGPHPDADKLQICDVDVGSRKPLRIVCGAANARQGMKTAVARVGARLPDIKVQMADIRGVSSQGMLCSRSELGLEEISSGIMELDSDAEVGRGLSEYLNLTDSVAEFELTPNRGDCLSIAGVAREVSTLTASKLKPPKISKVAATTKAALKVVLKCPTGCPRYVGRALTGIDIQARTPDWMVEKLRRCGHRSINPVVDVTNYVMHELGQPMHAFDLDRIDGGIVVRMAHPGESLELLDGSKVKLDVEHMVIADRSGAIALAGIMGGDHTATGEQTQNIYLEAAYFSADAILGKARQFGMHTDASHHFERGVDSRLQVQAIERATALILEIAGGQSGPVTHAVDKASLPKTKTVKLTKTQLRRTLGITIPLSRVTSILKRLGMTVSPVDDGWKVKIPSWRFDIHGGHDLVEEVGRCHGFDKVPPRMPEIKLRQFSHPESRIPQQRVRRGLAMLGFHEAIAYSFVDAKKQALILGNHSAIKLTNPIADNMSAMRQSLWPGLLDVLQTNLNRQEKHVRMFEIGHVFARARTATKCRETEMLGGLLCGAAQPLHWRGTTETADFFDLKGDIESLFAQLNVAGQLEFCSAEHPALHSGQCAQLLLEGTPVGYAGKLNPAHRNSLDIEPDVFLFEIKLNSLGCSNLPKFREISRFPTVDRDLAVLVDESVTVDSVLDLIWSVSGNRLKNVVLFDVYQGKNLEKNTKSLAFSLTLQAESSNLTATEADAVLEKIIKVLQDSLGAQLRK